MVKYEMADGSDRDLSRPDVQRSVLADIRRGHGKLVWIGMLCSSFSRARRGLPPSKQGPGSRMPCLLRTSESPWGLKGLGERDAHRVELANRRLLFSIKVMHALVLPEGRPFCA